MHGIASPLVQSTSVGTRSSSKIIKAKPLIDATTGAPFKHPTNFLLEPNSKTPVLTIIDANVSSYEKLFENILMEEQVSLAFAKNYI